MINEGDHPKSWPYEWFNCWQWPQSSAWPQPDMQWAWCEWHLQSCEGGGTPHAAVLQAQWGGWADQAASVICGLSCHNTLTQQQHQHRGINRGSNNSKPHSDMKVRFVHKFRAYQSNLKFPLISLAGMVRLVDKVWYCCNVNPSGLQDLVTIHLKIPSPCTQFIGLGFSDWFWNCVSLALCYEIELRDDDELNFR